MEHKKAKHNIKWLLSSHLLQMVINSTHQQLFKALENCLKKNASMEPKLQKPVPYSSLPNKRTCTPYLISTKLTPCRSYSGLQAYLFFWIFVKYSCLIWKIFEKHFEKN